MSTKSYTAKTTNKTYVWQNKNKLLKTYEYNIGGKTGFTEKARRTLVTASKKDEKTCIVVTLNDGNDFEDHKNLCEKVFKEYERVTILEKDNFFLEENKDYYVKESFYALLKKEEIEKIKINYNLQENPKEEVVGVAEIYLEDELLETVKIYQKEKQKTEKKEGFFKRFLGWLFKW